MVTNKSAWIGISAAIVLTILNFIFLWGDKLFPFLVGIAIVIAAAPFMINLLKESEKEEDISRLFLEFSRNLAESTVTGTPISKSIINISKKNYGALTPYIQKMANQIRLGIPVSIAMQNFANELDNKTIRRAVSLIREAEKAGGDIDYILESVANSISETEKLKKERKTAVFSLIVQGYLIFFIFIGIMLVMQFKILPLTYGAQSAGNLFSGSSSLTSIGTGISVGGGGFSANEISNMFLYLLLVQGFFAGLTIGKLSEGSLKAGIKHSFILTITALLVSTGIRAVLS